MNQPCNTCLPPRQSALATLQHEFAATAKINISPQTRNISPIICYNYSTFVPIRLIRVRFFVPLAQPKVLSLDNKNEKGFSFCIVLT